MSDASEENVAVEQLLAERDALHGWLERLDAATVSASTAVRERVRSDYQQQLDRVASDLGAHVETIAKKLAEDQAEHAELSSRTEASREELAEVELRHAVGEFSDDRYEADRKRHLSDIETFELSLAAVAARIRRMDDVLALVNRAPVSVVIGATDAPAEAVPALSILDLAPAAAPAPDSTAPGQVVESVDAIPIDLLAGDDETDRVLSVFSVPEEAGIEPADDEPPAASPTVLPDFGPLSFRPAGAVPPSEATPIGLPPDSPPRFVRPGDRLAPTAPAARPAAGAPATTSAGPPAPRPTPESGAPVPAEQGVFGEGIIASGPATAPPGMLAAGRTLRCSDCGAMNRPLVWYCEKCGAELSAV